MADQDIPKPTFKTFEAAALSLSMKFSMKIPSTSFAFCFQIRASSNTSVVKDSGQ